MPIRDFIIGQHIEKCRGASLTPTMKAGLFTTNKPYNVCRLSALPVGRKIILKIAVAGENREQSALLIEREMRLLLGPKFVRNLVLKPYRHHHKRLHFYLCAPTLHAEKYGEKVALKSQKAHDEIARKSSWP